MIIKRLLSGMCHRLPAIVNYKRQFKINNGLMANALLFEYVATETALWIKIFNNWLHWGVQKENIDNVLN